ncbi:hypothetical protein [Nocardia pneumoniae]|uniref:hypothetical protein n=1 Tax=Nocardia pneumoniae TaxID=228601 RepID=UPI000305332E|nr:hypothetical protein [Nocardia pneumoniae]
MVQPTPWQTSKQQHRQDDSASHGEGSTRKRRVDVARLLTPLKPFATALQGNWGYLCAAAGCVITFILLFKPWLSSSGPDGSIYSNAFGQTRITTTLVGLWSQKPPNHSNLNGMWAVLATAAIFVTVVAAVVNLLARTTALAHLTAGSAVAVALFVLCILVYLNAKGPELRAMVGSGPPTDLGVQIGYVIRWASGNGQYPLPGLRKVEFDTAKLTSTALVAGATSVFSAVVAVGQWFHRMKSLRRLRQSDEISSGTEQSGSSSMTTTP